MLQKTRISLILTAVVREGYTITSTRKGYFWQRRALEGVMFVCIATITLWALGKLGQLNDVAGVLAISDLSLLSACCMFILCLAAYLLPGNERRTTIPGAMGSKTAGFNTHQKGDASIQADVVIGAINDGVVALDAKGTITLFNPAAARLIGWTGGDALALNYKSVLKLVNDKDEPVPDASNPILATLNTNSSSETDQLSLVTGSGKRLMVSMIVSPAGEVGSGVIVVFRDITRMKTEEKQQAEFISTASHEMRTPVASIEGYLGLALNPNTAQVDQRAKSFIEKAHESAQHLGRLFQDLLDVSKADDGRLANHPKVIDVVDYVADIVEGLSEKASEHGLALTYVPRPLGEATGSNTVRVVAPVFYVNADKDHLREVVANLVENAIKYTPAGEVIIDVSGDEHHVDISVKDSGIGIPAEDIPHLFQKFYRVDNSDTREIGGTGLGLYLCRRLAEIMGGRIDVVSEFKKGSTFTLQLPRLDRIQTSKLLEEQKTAEALAASTTPVAPATATPLVIPSVPVAPTPPDVAVQSAPHGTPTQSQPPAAPVTAPVATAPPVQTPAPPVPVAARPTTVVQVPTRTDTPKNPPGI